MKKDLYVARSGIAGKGVFTKKAFKKGENILIFRGDKKVHFHKSPEESASDPNSVGIGKNLWVEVVDEITQYVNHSCNPNMGIKGRVTCVALCDIKKDEELTFDYSITEEDLFWEMKNGESKNIKYFRPKIKSIQTLPLEVFNRYMPYVPRYFQKVYKKYHGLNLKTRNKK